MDFSQAMRVLAAFARHGVEYVLVGSMAMAAQGLIRATRDMDVFVAPDAENVERLKAACDEGIDIDFENVGGAVFEAVWQRLNDFARVVVCGLVSQYNDTAPRPGPNIGVLLARRVTMRGFIVSDHLSSQPAFLSEIGPLVRAGRIKYKEDVVEGLERAPEALIGLLQGRNFGKVVVRVA